MDVNRISDTYTPLGRLTRDQAPPEPFPGQTFTKAEGESATQTPLPQEFQSLRTAVGKDSSDQAPLSLKEALVAADAVAEDIKVVGTQPRGLDRLHDLSNVRFIMPRYV